MLCRSKPDNPTLYYHIMDTALIHYLMKHGCYPLYSDGTTMYFVKNEETKKWMSEYKKSGGKEVV